MLKRDRSCYLGLYSIVKAAAFPHRFQITRPYTRWRIFSSLASSLSSSSSIFFLLSTSSDTHSPRRLFSSSLKTRCSFLLFLFFSSLLFPVSDFIKFRVLGFYSFSPGLESNCSFLSFKVGRDTNANLRSTVRVTSVVESLESCVLLLINCLW